MTNPSDSKTNLSKPARIPLLLIALGIITALIWITYLVWGHRLLTDIYNGELLHSLAPDKQKMPLSRYLRIADVSLLIANGIGLLIASAANSVLSRTVRWLICFALCILLFQVSLFLTRPAGWYDSPARSALRFIRMREGMDSWHPMFEAYGYAAQTHDTPLYEEIFFNHKTKFQYAPTSLLFTPMLTELAELKQNDSHITGNARYISWAFVLVTMLFTFLILRLGFIRQGLCPASLRHPDTIALLCTVVWLAFLFHPVMRSYHLGQLQTWINGLIPIAIFLWMTSNYFGSGLLIGLVCLMKPTYALVLLWGAINKRWHFLLGAFITLAIGLGASLWLFGLEDHLDYLHVLSFLTKHGESYFPNQSMNGLLNRLFMNGANLNWEPNIFPPFHPIVYWGSTLSSLALIAFLLYGARKRSNLPNTLDICLALLTATLASPIAWEHHYGILLPIYALALPYILKEQQNSRLLAWFGLSYALTSSFIPAAMKAASLTGLNLIQSYLYFGALILLVILYRIKPLPDSARGSKCASNSNGSCR